MSDISSGCYVVDSEYNVIDVNSTARELYPQLEVGQKCYQCLMGLDRPCGPCPVANGVQGPRTYRDPIRGISETVDAVSISVPGRGDCHALIFSTVGDLASYAATLPTTASELQDLALIKALTADFSDVFSVELAGGGITLFRHDGAAIEDSSVYKGTVPYEDANENYIARHVLPEDRESMRSQWALPAVTARLRSAESFMVHYRVRHNGSLHYYFRKFVRVGSPDSFDHIIVGVACEDDEALERQTMSKLAQELSEMELDSLTGLYTREAFFVRGAELLEAWPDQKFDFCILKLENITLIRHQYGNPAVDSVLALIGRLLKAYDDDHTCLTYMGDGFFASYTLNEPREIRKRKVNAFRDDILEKSPIKGLSMKWAIYVRADRTCSTEEIFEKTQYALSLIRHGADEDYIEFDQSVIDRMDWEETVKNSFDWALSEGQFKVWYQPKYSARTRQIVGAEALVRWVQPNGHMIPPDRFIPILEESGKISRLDEYVFRQVCRLESELPGRGLAQLPISVNLSRASVFIRDIAAVYADIAAGTGVSPELLPIEITESAAVRASSIRRFAEELNSCGFKLDMDDFGSGYSSLASLQIIPFRSIKLDKSLIDFIGIESGECLLRHTISFAKECGKTVIAEGVETAEQYLFLKALGCDMIQGYYFSKPVSEDVFISMLQH